jgi:hypothetical protein
MGEVLYFHCSKPKTVGSLNIDIKALFDEYKKDLAKRGLAPASVPHMDIQSTGYEMKDAEVTIRSAVRVVEERLDNAETANV